MSQLQQSYNRSVIVAFPSKAHGGCEEYALTVARAIHQQGFGIHSLFPKSEATQSLRDSFSEFERSYTSLTLRYWLPGRLRRLRFAWDILRITLFLLRKRPHAVHISLPWPDTATELLLACALLKVPTVITFQLVGENFKISPKLTRWYLWALGRNQKWVAVSENNRKILARAFGIAPQEIHLIYNGVTLPQPTLPLSPVLEMKGSPPPFILSVGRLSFQKGFDILLRAYATIQTLFPTYQLVLLGDGELRAELKSLAKQLNISDKVVFAGKRSDVPAWLAQATLFVLPSRSEGQSFALLEAMAAGLPIVASNTSSIPDLISHQEEGILFEKDNVSDLAEKLIEALSNPNQMAQLGINAQRKARQFSREAMLQDTLKLLRIGLYSDTTP